MRKYELIPEDGLFRLKCLNSFSDVKTGQLGGLVSGSKVILDNTEDISWVYDGSIVIDSTLKNTKVYGESLIINSQIKASDIMSSRVENSNIDDSNLESAFCKADIKKCRILTSMVTENVKNKFIEDDQEICTLNQIIVLKR